MTFCIATSSNCCLAFSKGGRTRPAMADQSSVACELLPKEFESVLRECDRTLVFGLHHGMFSFAAFQTYYTSARV